MPLMSNIGSSFPDFSEEKYLSEKGYFAICGIDEAGRGAWAGPLVSGAVILDIDDEVGGINDSKKLSKPKREVLDTVIRKKSRAYGIGLASVREINELGIQTATYLSYQRAINALVLKPDFILIDHYRLPGAPAPQKSISHGDQISLSIAAASILAKVERDKLMTTLANGKNFDYHFEKNYGYGTATHKDAITRKGLSDNHRIKFVSNLCSRTIQENLFDNLV